jgi:hypothetical protein
MSIGLLAAISFVVIASALYGAGLTWYAALAFAAVAYLFARYIDSGIRRRRPKKVPASEMSSSEAKAAASASQ